MDTKKEKDLKEKIKKQEKQLKKEKKVSKKLEARLKAEAKRFQKQFADRALKLFTSAFGLVAALAWNELIKEVIKVYIRPIFGEESGIISLLIYALFVTFLAVFITYQLSKIAGKENH